MPASSTLLILLISDFINASLQLSLEGAIYSFVVLMFFFFVTLFSSLTTVSAKRKNIRFKFFMILFFLLKIFRVIWNTLLKTKFCRSLRAIFGTGKKLRKKRYFFVALLQIKLYEKVRIGFLLERKMPQQAALETHSGVPLKLIGKSCRSNKK